MTSPAVMMVEWILSERHFFIDVPFLFGLTSPKKGTIAQKYE
jgi:hypothetical protein